MELFLSKLLRTKCALFPSPSFLGSSARLCSICQMNWEGGGGGVGGTRKRGEAEGHSGGDLPPPTSCRLYPSSAPLCLGSSATAATAASQCCPCHVPCSCTISGVSSCSPPPGPHFLSPTPLHTHTHTHTHTHLYLCLSHAAQVSLPLSPFSPFFLFLLD